MHPRLFPRGNAFRLPQLATWLILAALLCGLSTARADIQEPTIAKGKGAREQRREGPANGVAQSASIDQGGSVEITLRARGQIGKWIEFYIRTPPEHGSLEGPPRQLSRNSAVVTYVHRAGDGPGTDTFTYAVQAPGSAVSSAVPVTIEIRDTPPALVATPAELDFGAVKVGDTSGAELVLQNTGGGEAIGQLELPPPWSVEGSPDYRLGRGQRQSFHVLFGPRSGRSFSETLSLPGDSGSAPTHLLGTGLGPPGGPDTLTDKERVAQAKADFLANGRALAGNPVLSAEPAPAAATTPGARVAAEPPSSVPLAGNGVDPLQAVQVPADAATAPPSVPLDESGYITLYDTGIKQLTLREAGRTTLDVSWKPLAPAPKSYRVELRYLAIDDHTRLRVDWRPYAQVDVHVAKDLCTASVRGLPEGTRQTLRIVAVDAAGRIAGASATLQAVTLPPSTFWQVTPLKVLIALLLLCLGLALRRRWEVQQILRDIDESRAASAAALYRS